MEPTLISLTKETTSVPAPKVNATSSAAHHLVTPGETITDDPQYMKGHGVYMPAPDQYVSSVGGKVLRVNKLITVYPLRSRYTGNIGDVVVGRVTELGHKRWRVDISAHQDAVLQLSAIHLPGGVQRRKTEADENDMRQYFSEGDVFVSEIQAKRPGEPVQLHTRSTKYRKLRNGCLVVVPPYLIRRCKSHFYSLPNGVDVIVGMNGYVWVQKGATYDQAKAVVVNTATGQVGDELDSLYSSKNDFVSKDMRALIARVRNCIAVLASHDLPISDSLLMYAYEASLIHANVVDLLNVNVMSEIANQARLVYELSLQS